MKNIQSRISDLDAENKARKASYPVAGSLVPFVLQRSQVFTQTGGNLVPVVMRIRFTPAQQYQGNYNLILLRAEVAVDANFNERWPRLSYYTERQSGDGSVVIRVIIGTINWSNNFRVRVTASGVSGGTFTRF